jgi:hypothetical protein
MGERIGRTGRIDTDFFRVMCLEIREKSKKKIRANPPDPPNPFSHRITIVSQVLRFFKIPSFLIRVTRR